tara:strand:+ start:572 stop:892 length:321 start_codon:yes stop_codon:yes gene_type:complete
VAFFILLTTSARTWLVPTHFFSNIDRLRLTGSSNGRLLLLSILPIARSASESHADSLIMLYPDRCSGPLILESRRFLHPLEASAKKTLNSILVHVTKKLYKHVEPF